jgi:hypothetical protein
MSYSAITTAEIAVKKPVTNALMTKFKDNFDYLYSEAGGAPQLPVNGSFETDTDSDGIPDNWTRSLYSGGSGGLYTAAPAHGAKAAYFTHPGGAGNGGGYLKSSYIEVSQLQTYALFYIHWASVAGMQNYVQMEYYTSAKAFISETSLYSSTSNPTSATLFCTKFTPPSTARYIKICLIGGAVSVSVAGTAYFDGLWLVPAVVADMIVAIPDGSVSESKIVSSAVTQAKLKTSYGGFQASDGVHKTSGLAPGGDFGFGPVAKCPVSSGDTSAWLTKIYLMDEDSVTAADYLSYISAEGTGNSAHSFPYVRQRYVTASGEIYWIFMLRAKRDIQVGEYHNTSIKRQGDIVYSWHSPDHPCFGYGGKPLLLPHPFGDYDKDTFDLIVINPSTEEIEAMHVSCIVDDEMQADKDLLEIVHEEYEIDEESNPEWPDKEVTVGLPKKVLVDGVMVPVKNAPEGTPVIPITKIIPKPIYAITKNLKRK